MDTLVICSATAVIILSSGVLDNYQDGINGIQLTQLALSSTVGGWGVLLLLLRFFSLPLHRLLQIMPMLKVI